MSDIQLDTTGDIVLTSGDFVMLADAAAVGQHVSIRLKFLKGEFFRDTRLGVDYYGIIFQRPVNLPVIDALLKRAMLTTPGVDKILNYTSDLNTATRALTVTSTLQSGDTNIDFTTTIEEVIS